MWQRADATPGAQRAAVRAEPIDIAAARCEACERPSSGEVGGM